MKPTSEKAHIFIFVSITALVLLAGLTYGILTGRLFTSNNNNQDSAITLAKSKVRPGDSRESALLALSDAWFHAECMTVYTDSIEDLFFYGANNPDNVQVIIITSQKSGEDATVSSINTIENYMLHLYDHCIPLPTSAFDEN